MKPVKEGEALMFVTKKEDDAPKTKDIKTKKCFKCNKMRHYALGCPDKKTYIVAETVDGKKARRREK